MRRWFQRVVLARRWAAFLVLGVAFCVFGALTLNLFFVLRANILLVAEHGWDALLDGAAQQFVEIVVTGYVATAAYLVFKACEHRLVHDLCAPPPPAPETSTSSIVNEDRHPAR